MPIPPELGAATLRLLIVDDEKAVIQSLKRMLRRAAPQVEVLSASSGVEALLLLSEEKPQAALVDLSLRDLDSFELCRAVSTRQSLKGVTLVTMAVGVTPAVLAKSERAGAVRCLPKPVEVRELLSIFRVAIAMTQGT
jgi:CheY-like chemotaxis protein